MEDLTLTYEDLTLTNQVVVLGSVSAGNHDFSVSGDY